MADYGGRLAIGPSSIVAAWNGGGSDLTAGLTTDIYVPYACRILSATLLSDVAGDAEVDIQSAPFASYPPVGGDSIVGAAPPTLSSADTSQDATLTGWTTTVPANSTMRFVLDVVVGISRLSLVLKTLPL
jgi:hypothetical protein